MPRPCLEEAIDRSQRAAASLFASHLTRSEAHRVAVSRLPSLSLLKAYEGSQLLGCPDVICWLWGCCQGNRPHNQQRPVMCQQTYKDTKNMERICGFFSPNSTRETLYLLGYHLRREQEKTREGRSS